MNFFKSVNLFYHGYFIFFSVALLASCATTSDDTITVMSYNIRHGSDLSGVMALKQQAEFIKQYDVDLLALQEVDNKVQRSGMVDQPDFFAEYLTLNATFQKFMNYQGGEYGIAAFSKGSFKSTGEIKLPAGLEPRSMINGITKLDTHTIRFIPVHLDWIKDDATRLSQAQTLLNSLNRELPIILAGDFNDLPGSRVMKLFVDAGFKFTTKNRPTFHGDEEVEIDFIAVRSSHRKNISLVTSKVIEQRKLSDHAAIISVIRIQDK